MFLIADGNNITWAGFYALGRSMGLDTPERKVRAALLGLTQSVLGLAVNNGEPPGGRPGRGTPVTRMAVCFDQGRPHRRRGIFPAYQTGREKTGAFLEHEPFILEAIAQFIQLARSLPVDVVRGENTEADDLVASLTLASDEPVRIASTDRDFLQLVDERVSIYSPVKRLVITTDNFAEATAPKTSSGMPVPFPRERYLDYRAASGDASDDLPGIPGMGPQTAARLLQLAPLDDYFGHPRRVADALGRRNVKIEGAMASGEAQRIVELNRSLMDLRLGAAHFPNLEGLTQRGTWVEAHVRAWLAEHRITGVDPASAVAAMARVAGKPTPAPAPPSVQQGAFALE